MIGCAYEEGERSLYCNYIATALMIMAENTARFAGGKHLKGSYFDMLKKSGFLSVRERESQAPKEKPEETVARILGALAGE